MEKQREAERKKALKKTRKGICITGKVQGPVVMAALYRCLSLGKTALPPCSDGRGMQALGFRPSVAVSESLPKCLQVFQVKL